MIRVFPSKNNWQPKDELSFVGDPPMFRPPDQEVCVSCTFTWDIPEAERLGRSWSRFYSDVKVGGPAFGDPGGEFTPGLFLKNGVTITSRGCPWGCEFCFVPTREGKVRELEIKPGHIIQDNNLLACSRKHIEAVFEMLRGQKHPAKFVGGLDTRLLKLWHRPLFENARIKEIWVAADSKEAMQRLEFTHGFFEFLPYWKRRCYVMIGFGNETIAEAEGRLEAVYDAGFLPFSQLYRNEKPRHYSQEWLDLNRKWSRPAAYNKKRRV